MNENNFEISDDLLEMLSAEELVEMKIEVEDLLSKLDNILETCQVALNS